MWRISDAEEISKVVLSVWAAALLRNVFFDTLQEEGKLAYGVTG